MRGSLSFRRYQEAELQKIPTRKKKSDFPTRIMNFTGKVTKVADQIYQFTLLTPEFCRVLVRKAEEARNWMPESEVDKISGVINAEDPEAPSLVNIFDRYREKYYGIPWKSSMRGEHQEALPLASIPDMEPLYKEIVRRYVSPLLTRLWPTWVNGIWDQPYILKYSMNGQKGMGLHHDEELIAMVVYLNDDYTGGGTHFPLQKVTGKPPAGSALVFDGGISHPHMGVPVTSGCRYLLLGGFQ